MTSRSYDSVASSRRSGKERMTDDDVYQYAIRVSYLSYLLTPKPTETPAYNSTVDRGNDRDSREHHSRMSAAISHSIYSIGDVFDFGRDSQKPLRFPEKLLKVLDAKLRTIALGQDPHYKDQQLVRRTIGAFYTHLAKPDFLRQMEKNRKIEELILTFVTKATDTLKKEPTLQPDGWKMELNSHIALFVQILRDCLRSVNHVPPELTARVEMYTAKLTDGVEQAKKAQASTVRSPPVAAASNGNGYFGAQPSGTVADMPLVKTVGKLFGKSDQDLQQDVNSAKKFCTEKAALTDLKTCLKNIAADLPFPGNRDDFDLEAGFTQWKAQETSLLSQLMVMMIKTNPELAKPSLSEGNGSYSSPSNRPESMYMDGSSNRYSTAFGNGDGYESALSTTVTSDEEIETGHNFTYIPPNPKKYYKRLLELCMQYDLEAMVNLPEDQEVSLGILSPKHLDIINECALRWRLTHTYRVTCFLDVIKYKYEREEVPIECIPEALQMVQKAVDEVELEKWPRYDADYLSTVFGGLFNIFLGELYEGLEDITKLKPDAINPSISILQLIRESGLVERYKADIDARLKDLGDRVRIQAVHHYTDKNYELMSAEGENKALPLLLLTDHLEKQAKLLDKRFPEPLLGHLDLVCMALESQIPMFLTDLDGSRRSLLEGSITQPPKVPIEDMFALFRRTKTLLQMHKAFCPKSPLDFDLVGFFEPYVRQWLLMTDNKTAQWVHTAISVDKFEAEGDEGHSSSIVDLFTSLKSPIDFLLDLKWPDDYQEARFFTSLSKTISKSIEQYCRSIEDLFMEEMFPRPPAEVQQQKQSAWIEKAKMTIQGEKKVEPFNFTPISMVKLNNIEAARNLLDKMYARIDADRISAVLEENGPPVPEKVERPKFLFTVKVCLAENLVPLDSNPAAKLDTFVTLSDEKGNRLAKTRTIYESLDPIWDQTFDMSVESTVWLMASVRDKALIGKHDTVGRAYLCLDPRRFGDFLSHDLWFDLDTSGRLLIRVSMEGEKDDIQFYFGRAFRSLKRAENDMTRVIIDKMAPYIRQHLSRNVLKTLVKSTSAVISYDYNKAIGGVTAFYRSAMGTDKADTMIPLPQKDKPRVKPEALTDVEIEQAIVPLFDYFDANFQILHNHLSPTAKEGVMLKVWKQILGCIDGLLVPPLSDKPSDMKPLTDQEVDIVFKWLKFLRDYTYADGEGPVPLEQLQNQKYRDILSIRLYYDWHTDELMEECVRIMQQQLRSEPTVKKRAKTVYAQRNLGTIRERKKEKKQETQPGNAEIILRILRMRPNTSEFISQQLAVQASAQAEHEKKASTRRTKATKNRASKLSPVPPVPSLPS